MGNGFIESLEGRVFLSSPAFLGFDDLGEKITPASSYQVFGSIGNQRNVAMPALSETIQPNLSSYVTGKWYLSGTYSGMAGKTVIEREPMEGRVSFSSIKAFDLRIPELWQIKGKWRERGTTLILTPDYKALKKRATSFLTDTLQKNIKIKNVEFMPASIYCYNKKIHLEFETRMIYTFPKSNQPRWASIYYKMDGKKA